MLLLNAIITLHFSTSLCIALFLLDFKSFLLSFLHLANIYEATLLKMMLKLEICDEHGIIVISLTEFIVYNAT